MHQEKLQKKTAYSFFDHMTQENKITHLYIFYLNIFIFEEHGAIGVVGWVDKIWFLVLWIRFQ